MQDMFRIGVVASPHGLRGEVKIFPTTEEPSRFDTITTMRMCRLYSDGTFGEAESYEVSRLWYHKNMVVAKLSGIDDIEAAQRLKGLQILVPRDEAIPLAEGEYYVADLVGLRVLTEAGDCLGTLSQVIQTGANDVYAVQGSDSGKAPILIPAIKQCILGVDIGCGTITVRLMKGLL